MKRLIFLFVLLLLVTPVFGVTQVVVKPALNTSSSKPIILVKFNESITLSNYSFTKDNHEYPISQVSTDQKIFNFTPDDDLFKGLYILNISARDNVQNFIKITQPIQVDAPFMNIWVSSPHLGFADYKPFDAVISTENPANCKFGFNPNKPLNFIMPYNFAEGTTFGTTHTINNFGNNPYQFENSPDEDGKQKLVRVECNDTFAALHMGLVYLGYDPSAPGVSIDVDNLINDLAKPYTYLNVTTTDRSVCVYTENEIEKKFGNFDAENFDSYNKSHVVLLNYSNYAKLTVGDGLFDPKNITYSVNCTNLAGLGSETQNFDVEVAFEQNFNIIKMTPKNVTKNNNINFKVGTSVQTLNCKINEEDFDSNTANRIYEKNLGVLDEGLHTYNVSCVTGYSSVLKPFSFIIDSKPPSNLSIDVNSPTCGNKVSGNINFYDEQGIKIINYSIETLNGIIIKKGISFNGNFSENVNIGDFENKSPNARVHAIVYDKALNSAEISKEITIVRNSNLVCDKNPPTTSFAESTSPNGLEVNVFCSDLESGCKQRFDYGTSSEVDQCSLLNSKDLSESIIFNNDSYLCWSVYDLNNNNASQTEFINYSEYPTHCSNGILDSDEEKTDCGGSDCTSCQELPDHCSNGLLDGDETNTDCGGLDCAACGGGANCTLDSECESLICFNGTCAYPTCSDGIQNQEETDTDCGGPNCDACGDGDACIQNSDCDNLNCVNNICVTPTCTDGVQNQDEEGIDCGGSCPLTCNYPAHCSNGILDSDEEGLDCSGSCSACAENKQLELISPKNGVSKTKTFDLIIKSPEAASCGYSWSDLNGGLENYNPLAPGPNGVLHTKKDFNHTGVEGVEYAIYFACKLPDLSYIKENFMISWDTTPPIIEDISMNNGDSHTPPVITEYPLETTITVKTDDKSICKYSPNDVSYDSMSEMNGFDIYSFENTKHLSNLNDSENYKFYFQCENAAGDKTSKKSFEFLINTSAASGITILSPEKLGKEKSVKLIISLNRDASKCTYKDDNNNSNNMNLINPRRFESSQLTLNDGNHLFGFDCLTASKGPISTVYSFTIDSTPPTTPVVNDGDTFSSITQLGASWESNEDYSNINLYQYSIGTSKGNNDIKQWTNTTLKGISVNNLILTNNTQYYWNVKARNEVGLWSQIGLSDGVLVLVGDNTPTHCSNGILDSDEERLDCGGLECGSCQQLPDNCSNGILDGDESDIDCGGACLACSTNSSCSINSDCDSRNCVEDICQEATCNDSIQNQGEADVDCGGTSNCGSCQTNIHCSDGILNEDEERIDCGGLDCNVCPPLPDHCSNSVKDELESDTDCGGPDCNACTAGDYCSVNSDCDSRNCIDNVCISSLCYDDIQNGDETGLDCGGSCLACSSGESCVVNDDCYSGECSDNVCVEINDSDGDGMPDYWEEKYGLNPNNSTDASEDLDKDGFTNLEEYLAKTDPTNPDDSPADSDEDGMPDYWEEKYGLNPNDPTDASEDLDGDKFTNLEEYLNGTDPTVPNLTNKAGFDWVAFIVLILGFLMTAGSSGYIYYKKNYVDKPEEQGTEFDTNLDESKEDIPTIDNTEELNKEKQIFEQRAKEKEKHRHDLVSKFSSGDLNETKKVMNDLASKEADSSDKKPKSKKKSDVSKSEDKIDEDIFAKLDKIGDDDSDGEKSQQESDSSTSKTKQSSSDLKKDKGKKNQSESSKKDSVDADAKDDTDKKLSKSDDEIFKELATMSGRSHKEIKDKVKKGEFNHKEILKIFNDVKKKDDIKSNVFKNVLSSLLSKGHLDKPKVAEVLFSYFDKGLLSKKEISDILKELDLVKK